VRAVQSTSVHLSTAPLTLITPRPLAAGAFGGPQVDTAKIEAFFDGYKDEGGESVRRGDVNPRPAAFCARQR
jgi:hypothetical protein